MSDTPKVPTELTYQGARYVLAGRKRGRKSATIQDSGYRHDGVMFYIKMLIKSKTGQNLPSSFAKRINKIPESITLNEQDTVAAKKAIGQSGRKKDSELWYVKIDATWNWRDEPKSVKVTPGVQAALSLIDKYRNWERPGANPLIYAEVITKIIGGRK